MLKATGKLNGRDTLFIGLSFGNLKRFRAGPLDSFITIPAEEVGLSHDIVILSGQTEQDIQAFLLTTSVPPKATMS